MGGGPSCVSSRCVALDGEVADDGERRRLVGGGGRRLELRPEVFRYLGRQVPQAMGEAVLARRARKAGLDRLDDALRAVRDHQQGIAEAAPAHAPKERAHRLGVLLGAGHQVQQDLGAGHSEAPGSQHRLALLPRPDALGNAVHEQVGDLVFAQVSDRELLIVGPQPLADLRLRSARQQQPPTLVPERLLDVAHAQAARQKLYRQVLKRLGDPTGSRGSPPPTLPRQSNGSPASSGVGGVHPISSVSR